MISQIIIEIKGQVNALSIIAFACIIFVFKQKLSIFFDFSELNLTNFFSFYIIGLNK